MLRPDEDMVSGQGLHKTMRPGGGLANGESIVMKTWRPDDPSSLGLCKEMCPDSGDLAILTPVGALNNRGLISALKNAKISSCAFCISSYVFHGTISIIPSASAILRFFLRL